MMRTAFSVVDNPPKSSFRSGVSHIGLCCAYEKVIWIAARWVVAMMAHVQSLWDWSIVEHPRCPTCENHFLISFIDTSVTVSVFISRPLPTRFCYFNLAPESRAKRYGKSLIEHPLGSTENLHNRFFRLCHALGCSFTARALSL